MKNTFRNVLVATVASSLLLGACSGKRDENAQQQPKITGPLHAPRNNPQLNDQGRTVQEMRAPEANLQGVGSQYAGVPASQQPQVIPSAPSQAAPAQKEKSGMFSWAYRDEPQPVVNTAERRVPKLNQDPTASLSDMGMASYEAAAPVAVVDMGTPVYDQQFAQDEWAAPQQEIIVAEELAVMDEPFTPVAIQQPQQTGYPSLSSVPPRPERVDVAAVQESRMADMEAARVESLAQQQSLSAQMAQDEWTAPQSDIDAEFAALVGADTGGDQGYGRVISAETQVDVTEQASMRQEPAPQMYSSVAQPWEMPAGEAVDQAPAPIEMASAQTPVVQSWEPVPMNATQGMIAPQDDVMMPQTEVVVQEGEWVSLHQDPAAQMAVPVEGVEVGGAPEVASVSAIPVVPVDNASGIQLTPPSAYGRTVRTLPESRYASRRQAVYMQRYARQVQSDEGY